MIEHPDLTNTIKEFFVRAVESGFYLSAMGDPIEGVAKKEYVQVPLLPYFPYTDLVHFQII
jgi:hypothetical protein